MAYDPNATATDVNLEENGVWVAFPDGGRVKVGRIHSDRWNEALEKARKPYQNMYRSGRTIPPAVVKKVWAQTIATGALFGWEGFTIPYSPAAALKLLTENRTFLRDIELCISADEAFRKEVEAAAEGNSESAPDGTPSTAIE